MLADSSINQNIVRPSIVARSIRWMRNTGISLYVHGAPGISKSAVCRQVADELKIAFIDFRLTSVAPEDIRGVPFLDDVGGMKGMIWTPPLLFPRDLDLIGVVDVEGTQIVKFYNPIGNNGIAYCREPNITAMPLNPAQTVDVIETKADRFVVVLKENGAIANGKVIWTVTGRSDAIFALEEFNSAMPTVMAAAYQLILDRRIGDYVVPDGVMLVAMGNRDGDKGVTYKIPKPVENRFVHLEMEVNHDDWQQWAMLNGIHSDVIGYLAKWTSHLMDNNFAKNTEHAFATPRSWEFVSRIISQPDGPPEVLKPLICGAIGNVTGTAFCMHRKFMEDMPNVQGIFSGDVKTLKIRNDQFRIQIAYSTSVEMCYELKKESDAIDRKYNSERLQIDRSPEREKWSQKADNAIGFAMDNFTPEVMVVFQKMAIKIYHLRFNTKNMKNFAKFAAEYRNLVIS